jgi:hypothetical protein
VQKKKRNRWTSCTAITTQSCLFLRGLASVGGSCPLSLVSFFFYSALALRRQSGRGFVCGWPIPIITGPLVVGLFWCFWSLLLSCLLLRGLASVGGSSLVSWMLVSFGVIGLFWCYWSLLVLLVSFAVWLGFCGRFMPIITGLFSFCFSVGGLCPLSLVSLLLVTFGVIGLFCSRTLPEPLSPNLPADLRTQKRPN